MRMGVGFDEIKVNGQINHGLVTMFREGRKR